MRASLLALLVTIGVLLSSAPSRAEDAKEPRTPHFRVIGMGLPIPGLGLGVSIADRIAVDVAGGYIDLGGIGSFGYYQGRAGVRIVSTPTRIEGFRTSLLAHVGLMHLRTEGYSDGYAKAHQGTFVIGTIDVDWTSLGPWGGVTLGLGFGVARVTSQEIKDNRLEKQAPWGTSPYVTAYAGYAF